MTACAVRSLSVWYGSTVAVDGLDLEVDEGETVAVLGPSGSGKTSLLSAVAGFVPPATGEVWIDGRRVAGPDGALPPEQRSTAVVFQNYALWPHLTATETVAYPMRRSGASREAATIRARQLLERMGIAELAERRPAEMSGGQQQRVGLARALARDAAVYLFDEPTAHLDAALRSVVAAEIDHRRRETGAAALYASHDAAEALAVADRVVLLRAGRCVQEGSPTEIYAEPVDLWAARLTGPASLLEAAVQARGDGIVRLRVGDRSVQVAGGGGGDRPLVRPDWCGLGGELEAVVAHRAYRGPHTDYRLDTAGGEVLVRSPGPPTLGVGERTGWSIRRVWLV